MQLYSAKVRLSGSLYNEVRKDELTAPEILLLRSIHGGTEAVTEVKATGKEAFDVDEEGSRKLRTDKGERARLKRIYDPYAKKLDKLFGPMGALPQVLEDDFAVVEDAKPVRRQKAPEPAQMEV
jgi:hypothetical protein